MAKGSVNQLATFNFLEFEVELYSGAKKLVIAQNYADAVLRAMDHHPDSAKVKSITYIKNVYYEVIHGYRSIGGNNVGKSD